MTTPCIILCVEWESLTHLHFSSPVYFTEVKLEKKKKLMRFNNRPIVLFFLKDQLIISKNKNNYTNLTKDYKWKTRTCQAILLIIGMKNT